MGWFEKAPEIKATLCPCCNLVLKSELEYSVCDKCGHLMLEEACLCQQEE